MIPALGPRDSSRPALCVHPDRGVEQHRDRDPLAPRTSARPMKEVPSRAVLPHEMSGRRTGVSSHGRTRARAAAIRSTAASSYGRRDNLQSGRDSRRREPARRARGGEVPEHVERIGEAPVPYPIDGIAVDRDGPVGVGTAPPVQFAVSSTSTVNSVLTSESGTNRASYVRTGPGGIGPVGG